MKYVAVKEEEKKRKRREERVIEESTISHMKEEKDWQGRSYMTPPPETKIGEEHKCFIPKRHFHTW